MVKNALAAGFALLGELTALPHTPGWTTGRGGREGERKRKRKRADEGRGGRERERRGGSE